MGTPGKFFPNTFWQKGSISHMPTVGMPHQRAAREKPPIPAQMSTCFNAAPVMDSREPHKSIDPIQTSINRAQARPDDGRPGLSHP